MTAEHLLLVDDSDAILAFEASVLSPYYTISTASTGREALTSMRRAPPDGVLLDLSMPEMDGEAVLAAMRGDSSLADLPVVVVSSEATRARSLVGRLADAYVPKPIPADVLLATVARVLAEREAARRKRGLACLVLQVGEYVFGLPISAVAMVLSELETHPLPAAPPHLREVFELEGRPVLVLDLASALGVTSRVPRLDRMLVVTRFGDHELALRVDGVADPEDIPHEHVVSFASLSGSDDPSMRAAIKALVRVDERHIAVLTERALLDPSILPLLGPLLEEAQALVEAPR